MGLIFFLSISLTSVYSQNDSVSLLQCFREARENAALKPQLELISAISKSKIENASSGNLPSLSAYGKAWYQNEAMAIDLPIPNMQGIEVNRFQYNFGVEADQKIFDGGVAGKVKEVEKASAESDKNKVETNLYQINDRITRYFFASLLFEESKKTLELKLDILGKRSKEIESGVKNGIIKRSEYDKIKAEALLTEQQLLELEKNNSQMLNALQILTGLKFSDKAILFVPDSLMELGFASRPEYNYFDAENLKIEKSIKLKSAQNLPKFYAFGQLGYSYPGLNLFKNSADYYYIVGAKLSWTIFDWNQVKREKQILRKQEEIVKTSRDDFDQNQMISSQDEKIEQEKLLQLIDMDKQIIDQRAAISASSASMLTNGIITSAVYIDDLNAEIKARIDLETHKIQYQNSIVKSYILNGIQLSKP